MDKSGWCARLAFRQRTALLSTLSVVSLALASCTGEDMDGDIRVETLPLLRAQADMRIGDRDDPEVGFSRVAGISFPKSSRKGQIWVT